METQSINGHAREGQEQGVTSASLRLRLANTHCVRNGENSRVRVRTHCISTRLNEEELAVLFANAQVQHMKLGALLRQTFFNGSRPAVPQVNVEKWTALGGALEDLHTLAFQANAGHIADDFRPVLAETIEQVHALRADLVGQTAKGEKS